MSNLSLKLPQLPEGGGQAGLVRAIQQRVVYPQSALRKGLQGQCLVRFAVTPDGQVRRVKIVRSLSAVLDSAVVRAVRQLPHLEPATQFGKPVACPMTAPIVFTISNPRPLKKKLAPAADSTQFYSAVTNMPLYRGQAGFSQLSADLVAEYGHLRAETGCFIPNTNLGVLLTIEPSGRLADLELSPGDEQEYNALLAEYGDAVARHEGPQLPEACVALLAQAAQHLPHLVPAHSDGKRVAMRVQLTLLAPQSN